MVFWFEFGKLKEIRQPVQDSISMHSSAAGYSINGILALMLYQHFMYFKFCTT